MCGSVIHLKFERLKVDFTHIMNGNEVYIFATLKVKTKLLPCLLVFNFYCLIRGILVLRWPVNVVFIFYLLHFCFVLEFIKLLY